MIKAKDFNNYIEDKTNQTLYQLKGYTGLYTLKQACFEFALLLNTFRKKNKGIIKENQLARKLATRLEREFLRNEKEAITLDYNEVVILVHYGCIELGIITIRNMKAATSCFYNLKHLYTDLLVQHRNEVLFKEIGNYELKGKLEINQYGVEIWNFELIDFKPEVSNEN